MVKSSESNREKEAPFLFALPLLQLYLSPLPLCIPPAQLLRQPFLPSFAASCSLSSAFFGDCYDSCLICRFNFVLRINWQGNHSKHVNEAGKIGLHSKVWLFSSYSATVYKTVFSLRSYSLPWSLLISPLFFGSVYIKKSSIRLPRCFSTFHMSSGWRP